MAETRKQYMAACPKAINHTAIHHSKHKDYHQYTTCIHFHQSV